jgi:hypothetical protein
MKNISLLTISLIHSFLSSKVIAQVPDTTLAKQYEEVVIKSGSYKVYKNIRKTKIEQFWKNVNDSLKQQQQLGLQSKAELEKSFQTISAMQTEIDSFKVSASSIGKLSNWDLNEGIVKLIVLMGRSAPACCSTCLCHFKDAQRGKRSQLSHRNCAQLFEELCGNRSKANEREKN